MVSTEWFFDRWRKVFVVDVGCEGIIVYFRRYIPIPDSRKFLSRSFSRRRKDVEKERRVFDTIARSIHVTRFDWWIL